MERKVLLAEFDRVTRMSGIEEIQKKIEYKKSLK
jgi:hypothetical protein